MSALAIGWISIGAGMALMAAGFPIGVALGSVSFIGIWMITSETAAWGMLTAIPYNFAGSWDLSAVPMFLFMGFIAANSGLTKGLFKAMQMFLIRLPGGLACASVGACAMFSAVFMTRSAILVGESSKVYVIVFGCTNGLFAETPRFAFNTDSTTTSTGGMPSRSSSHCSQSTSAGNPQMP